MSATDRRRRTAGVGRRPGPQKERLVEFAKPLSKRRFGFLTLPNFSMIALSTAVEPLRMANRICNQEAYEWSIASLDGQPVTASNGLSFSPTVALDDVGPVNVIFVCGGINVQQAVTPQLLAALRRLAQRHVDLGSLCTGSYALAKAGLLDDYRTAIHWENMSALREEFPRVRFVEQLFAIDRDRFTCSGGVAPLDLTLNMIKNHLGGDIAPLI
jgi:transcriptional regulator GlxA family with amidase domain